MKRLIVILVLFTGFVTFAIAQQAMTIAGNGVIFIDTGGIMRSDGDVHVKTADMTKTPPDTIGGRIENKGTFEAGEKLILYSDDKTDGLLKNANTTSGSVKADTVVVRKKFKDHELSAGSHGGYYYIFSIPFDVELYATTYGSSGSHTSRNTEKSGIFKTDGSGEATLWSDYEVAFYDTYRRAFVTRKAEGNWVWFDEDSTIFKGKAAYLTAGQGYRIYSKHEFLDFKLKDATQISNLLNLSDKESKAFNYDKDNYREGNDVSEGWNVLGGLNTTAFDPSKIEITGGGDKKPQMIQYWSGKSVGFKDLLLEDPEERVIISPYVTFYIQATAKNQQLKFNKDGLVVDKPNPVGFRAAAASTKDLLRLTIASNDKPSLSDKAYIELAEADEERFKAGEDALKMFNDSGESSLFLQIYSWFNKKFENSQTKESSVVLYELALNSLPPVTQEVKLGVISPSAGKYTFGLNAIQQLSLKSAVLKDVSENKETDLLQGTYTCDLIKGKIADRFILLVDNGALPVDEIEVTGTDIFAYANNNLLTVKNLQKGDRIKVLDLSGRVVASGIAPGNAFSTSLIQKGVYIVNVKGGKAAVLKVINK
jgi:hypothetical protein